MPGNEGHQERPTPNRYQASAGGILSARRSCTDLLDSGQFCDAPVDEGVPVTLCRRHLQRAYQHVREEIFAGAAQERREWQAWMEEQRQPPAQPEPVVYYIRFGDRIKIGWSGNLKQRLTALPHDELLATEPGDGRLEHLRHQQFAGSRIRRSEWFHYSDDLRRHVAMLLEHYAAASA